MKHPVTRRKSESGFALLFIFVLAAGIALALLMQLPRFAFETQRSREQLLIDRGEQYQRAISLYYRKYKRYPSKMEDLENTDNLRFLRKRYVDPMTGKDEWRIIHANAAGMLVDSLVQKTPAQQGQGKKDGQSDITGITNPGNTTGTDQDPNAPPQVNMAAARRPSDKQFGPGMVGGGAYDPNQPGADPNAPGQTGQPAYPGGVVGQVGVPQPGQPGYPGQPGQAGTPGQYPGQAGQPGQPMYPGQTGQPGQPYNPMQGMPGVVNPNGAIQRPGMPQQGFQPTQGTPPVINGQQGMPQGFQPGTGAPPTYGGQNPALNMINAGLRAPSQGPQSAFNNNNMSGGGTFIAGVATKYKGPSIKIYKDHQKYQEWEFVYDLKNDPVMNPQMQTGAGGNAPPGSPPTSSAPGGGNLTPPSNTTQPTGR